MSPEEWVPPRNTVTHRRRSILGKFVNEAGFSVYSGFWWKLALPEVILPVHLAVAVGTGAWAASRAGSSWTTVAVGVPLGFFIWTLFEYTFHRWVLHHKRHPLLRKIFWNGLHREHHMSPDMKDLDHHGIHLAVSLPLVLLLVGSVGLATESGWGLAVAAGWILGYCLYEALHWLFHSADPARGLGKLAPIHRLSAAHTVHHMYQAKKNYGFIALFWDRCFGTYLPLEETRPSGGKGYRRRVQGHDEKDRGPSTKGGSES